MNDELKALDDAYRILDDAAGEICNEVSLLAWRMVNHARKYIQAQADALLAPMFADPEF